jgi:hypothetical protein
MWSWAAANEISPHQDGTSTTVGSSTMSCHTNCTVSARRHRTHVPWCLHHTCKCDDRSGCLCSLATCFAESDVCPMQTHMHVIWLNIGTTDLHCRHGLAPDRNTAISYSVARCLVEPRRSYASQRVKDTGGHLSSPVSVYALHSLQLSCIRLKRYQLKHSLVTTTADRATSIRFSDPMT